MKWPFGGAKNEPSGGAARGHGETAAGRVYAFVIVNARVADDAVDYIVQQALQQVERDDWNFGEVMRATEASHAPLEFNAAVMDNLPTEVVAVEMFATWLHTGCGLPLEETDKMCGDRNWTARGTIRDKVEGSTFEWLAVVSYR